MWNGKWNKELKLLYEAYFDLFGSEPDCDLEETTQVDFDSVSYNDFKNKIIRSISTGQPIR